MIRSIMRDPMFLRLPSEPADRTDIAAARDLVDTLRAHADECVGMAGNMIGVRRRFIAFRDVLGETVMYNPEIIEKHDPWTAEEGCLSLIGVRRTTRYRTIRVRFLDASFTERERTLTGFPAQIVQHEIDHLNGILI